MKLKEYKTKADEKTQTYRAVFTMIAPKDFKILPGMTATMIVTEKASRTTSHIGAIQKPYTANTVPNNAVQIFVSNYDKINLYQ